MLRSMQHSELVLEFLAIALHPTHLVSTYFLRMRLAHSREELGRHNPRAVTNSPIKRCAGHVGYGEYRAPRAPLCIAIKLLMPFSPGTRPHSPVGYLRPGDIASRRSCELAVRLDFECRRQTRNIRITCSVIAVGLSCTILRYGCLRLLPGRGCTLGTLIPIRRSTAFDQSNDEMIVRMTGIPMLDEACVQHAHAMQLLVVVITRPFFTRAIHIRLMTTPRIWCLIVKRIDCLRQ
jgi:hypothetical protein